MGKARRIGGSTYQVPIEVSGFRATNLSLRWIIQYSKQRVGRSMAIKLANEIIDTANEVGNTIKKKEDKITSVSKLSTTAWSLYSSLYNNSKETKFSSSKSSSSTLNIRIRSYGVYSRNWS